MITNCGKCGKVTVIPRSEYKPKKPALCKKCKDSGLMRRILTSLKGTFKPKSEFSGVRPVGA